MMCPSTTKVYSLYFKMPVMFPSHFLSITEPERCCLVSNVIEGLLWREAGQINVFTVTKWLFGFVCLIGAKNLVVS